MNALRKALGEAHGEHLYVQTVPKRFLMQAIRHIFVFVTFLLTILFMSPTSVDAQTAVDYRFLEVIDIAGKPVAEAKVESLGSGRASSQKTGEDGTGRLPFYSDDFRTSSFKASKLGYFTYEGTRSLSDSPSKYLYWLLRNAEIPQYDPKKIKIVLLKILTNVAERKALEAEQRKQELLLAIKHGDSATVQKLLQIGVSANTTNVHGIPAILWAAASGDVETIKALLVAGANVRNKSRPGRKALLYYLLNVPQQITTNPGLVQRLVNLGADVNASSKDRETVLSLARRSGDTKIIKLLESAGARQSATR